MPVLYNHTGCAGAAADGDGVRRETLRPLTWWTADAHVHVRVEGWLLGSKVKDSSGGDYHLRIRSDGLTAPPLLRRVKGRGWRSRTSSTCLQPPASQLELHLSGPATSPSICSHFNFYQLTLTLTAAAACLMR